MSSAFTAKEWSPSEFPLTEEVIRNALKARATPAIAVSLWSHRHPQTLWVRQAGEKRWLPTSQPLERTTCFDLASLTKILVTAPLVARFVERGWLSWSTPLQAILPEFRHPKVTFAHLLSHTSGFVAWEPFWQLLRDSFSPVEVHEVAPEVRRARMLEHLLKLDPVMPPGEKAVYSDIGFLLLGFALERIGGKSLDRLARDLIWEPLRLESLHFRTVTQNATAAQDSGYAATENCPWRGGVLQGQVHDDNCWAMGGVAGHAGVFGRAEDVARFAAHLMNGALSPSVTNAMWTRVSHPPGCERTLGWDTPSGESPSVGAHFSPQTVGHLGFTGTSLWIDLKDRLAVTLLTNRVHPSRENPAIKDMRIQIHNALRKDLKSP